MVVVVPEWKSLFKCAVLCCTNIICPLVRDEGSLRSVPPQMSNASENNKTGSARAIIKLLRLGGDWED